MCHEFDPSTTEDPPCGDRLITRNIARLRTGHHRGMKFDRDGRRSYRNWDNCLDTELTPVHVFAALQEN
ncbi:hypothetical protein TNCV_1020251 [Trichonephila clavipes]|nr:hypothetical protein TNCV_1020251 [Trichonephila clavipes]